MIEIKSVRMEFPTDANLHLRLVSLLRLSRIYTKLSQMPVELFQKGKS